MAQQTINVGASANDGTGSPLRTAFQYTNSNFTELYAALGGGTGLPGAANQVLFNNGSAIAGDAGMTYNPSTDTMTLVNLVLSGTFAARNGDTPSAIRAAASDYAAVAFDGATASTRIASTITTNPITTGDYTVWSRFRVPATTSSNQDPLWTLGSDALGAGAYGIIARYFTASNLLNILLRSSAGGASGGDSATADVTIPFANYAGQVVDLVVVRVGSALTVYLNGTSLSVTYGGTQASFALAPGNYPTNPAQLFGVGASTTTPFRGRIYRSVVFNRALSAADVTELITVGVNPADQWGTQTQVIGFNPAVLNGGFETNSLNASGTWATSVGGTSTATIDTSGSFSRTGTNAGKLTLDGSGSFASFQGSNGSTSFLAVNKRYRISIWARKGATSGSCGVQFGPIGSGAAYGNTGLSLTTSYANTVVEVVSSIDGGITLGRQASSAALSEIYIDDVEITRIGAIVDLDFTVGTGYQATDRSTNALHGTLFNGVEFTQPKRVAVLYATTAASGNTQILGSLAIPTNAVIEDVIVNSTGSSTVSVGNVSAGTQIVNGASVVSGRQKLTIATPFSTTGNLWVNSSAAVTLQFTILYTIAA
jgi:uncharacterized ubiquitin-like protein YukD